MDELTNNPESSPQSSPAPFPEPSAPQRDLRGIFVAKSGLIRAGWGVLLFILIFLALGFSIGHLLRHFLHHHPHSNAFTAKSGLLSEGVQLLLVIIATGIMAIIERKSLFAYGYQGAARAVRFFSGLVWGFVAISTLVLVLWKSHLLVFDGQFLHGAALLKYAAAWGLVFLLVGLFEESTLRGYLQFTVTRGIGFWWAALLFSFLFGLGHSSNPGESPVGIFAAGAVGLVFCLSIWYTGSLWWAVGFHAAWDWGESYFYGTSDSGLISQGHLFGEHPLGKILWSGGTTGPEGSLFIVPLLILIALFMWLWWGRRLQSPFAGSGWRPAWSREPAVIEPESAQEGAV
ncbi:MAG: CPBP family intramembrane glutamic endopeptidase [Silvibacterium sp.]